MISWWQQRPKSTEEKVEKQEANWGWFLDFLILSGLLYVEKARRKGFQHVDMKEWMMIHMMSKKTASFGCVNIRPGFSKQLFDFIAQNFANKWGRKFWDAKWKTCVNCERFPHANKDPDPSNAGSDIHWVASFTFGEFTLRGFPSAKVVKDIFINMHNRHEGCLFIIHFQVFRVFKEDSF